jgi:hypothetical protein
MNVSVKSLKVEMSLKNKGMELEVRNNEGDFLGDMVINKRGLTWCQGRTSVQNGTQIGWEDIINYFEYKKKNA